MNKLVSVVLPIKNEELSVSECIDSILSQDYPMDKLEILALDGMSDDSTKKILEDYVEKYENMRIIDNPGRIVPKALNIGIENARGNVIIRMDAHSVYPHDYIKKSIEHLNKTGANNVGGVIEHRGSGSTGRAIALTQGCIFGLGGAKFRTAKKEQYVDTVFPGCWPRKTFEKFGYFNENLVRNQDIEYNSRIRKAGGKIFLTPEIKSYYYCKSTLKDLWIQYLRNGFWNIKTVKISPGSLSLRHFTPFFFILSLIVCLSFLALNSSHVLRFLPFTLVAGSYALATLFFSAKIAGKHGLKYFPILPAVFATLHFSCGIGSILGLLSGIKWKITTGRGKDKH